MPLASGTRFGPYEVGAPLGAGGMGEVYRARDTRLGRDVALRVLPAGALSDADQLRRFEQEARAAGSLNHPNILAIHDVGTDGGRPYVVCELLEGQTLRERLAGAALPARKAMDVAVQVAHGLAAAHEKGIVHRDLKPENVFITRDGRVKILDFGLAKLTASPEAGADDATAAGLTPAPHDDHATDPGKVLGTVGYMSPEQVRAQPVDHRSDIFSFGAILYEMLTGRRAFQGRSAVETMSAILRDDPPELHAASLAIPPGFESVVRHCLEKSPDERFQSARDLAFNLQALSGLSSASGVVAALPVGRPSSRRRLWVVAVGVPLVAAAAFLLGRRTGLAEPPAFHQLTFNRGAILSARFAPDGQTVVYGAAWNGRPFEIFSVQPGRPESRPLGLAGDLVAMAPNGELALSLNQRLRGGLQFFGTLARVPLSGGAPREVLEGALDAAWAPDGNSLAVVRTANGRDRLEYPVGTVLSETVGWISHPRFAPDGTIAFLDHPHWPDDAGSVVLVDRGGRKTVLASGWQSLAGLAWAPGGREVWFTGSESGKARAIHAVSRSGQLRLVTRVAGRLTLQDLAADGRGLLTRDTVRIEMAGRAPGAARERDLSWLDGSMSEDLSADGRQVLFSETGEGGGAHAGAYLRKTDGSPAVRLGDGLPAALSPDGKWALTLQPGAAAPLVFLPTGPGESRSLSAAPRKDYLWAGWMPDGKRLVINGAEEGHGLRAYLLDPAGGAPRPMTPEGYWAAAVSPDGRQLATIGSGQPVSLVPVAGGEPKAVPGSLPGDRAFQWSDDGLRLYVFRRDELPCRIYRLDLAGGRELFRELMPTDPAGVLAIHEVQLAGDGNAYTYSYARVLSELYLADGLR